MPELPEVETVVRQLAPALAGRRIRAVEILDEKLRGLEAHRAELIGRSIGAVERRGKRIALALHRPRACQPAGWLVVHLRMTGRLLLARDTPPGHLRLRLKLDRGALEFADVRRFGTVEWITDEARLAPPGLDPYDPAFTPAWLQATGGTSQTPLKPWLLRQDRITGLGNIYAAEACWRARLDPRRRAASLSRTDWRRLHGVIRGLLDEAIEACGTTFSDFQDSRGLEGGFGALLAVYGRAGEPCRGCGRALVGIVQAQRSTVFCPKCQR
jgi:formamidopyrimidine-DNA glycosylase